MSQMVPSTENEKQIINLVYFSDDSMDSDEDFNLEEEHYLNTWTVKLSKCVSSGNHPLVGIQNICLYLSSFI